jgi:hypothetical protein
MRRQPFPAVTRRRSRSRARTFFSNHHQHSTTLLSTHAFTTMICRQCLTRATALVRRPPPSSRLPFSVLAARRIPEPAAPILTTPTTPPAGEAAPPKPAAEATAATAEPKSSCPAGTVLTGLNYFKGMQDPVALPDEAYPEWLWKCLELPPRPEAASSTVADEFCMGVFFFFRRCLLSFLR